MRKLHLRFAVIIMAAFLAQNIFAQTNASVEKEVIAITYAQWKADMDKNSSEANKIFADEYAEFNGDYSTRIDGKSLNVKFLEASNKNSDQILAAEMLNPKVQVYGDVAILSYNYAGVTKDKDGKIHNNKAKSTRVYAKINGSWKLVHANFGSDPVEE